MIKLAIRLLYIIISVILFSTCERIPENDKVLVHLTDQWYHFQNIKLDKKALNITSICIDNNQSIYFSAVWDSTYITDSTYICTPNGCIWYYNYNTLNKSYILNVFGLKTEEFIHDSRVEYQDHYISSLGFNSKDNLFIGTSIKNGLIECGKFSYHIYYPQGGLSYYYEKFNFDFNDNLWFGSGNGGLYKIMNGTISTYDRTNSIISYPEKVKYISFDKNEVLWFNTTTDLLKLENNEFEIMDISNCVEIYSTIVDNYNDVWIISSRFNNRIHMDQEYFLSKIILNNTRDSVSSEEFYLLPVTIDYRGIGDILTDTKNNIWISTKSGLLKFESGQWEIYNKENSQIQSNNLTRLYIDGYDNIWIGSFDNGLSIFNPHGIQYEEMN